MEEARPGMKSWRRTVEAGVGRSKTWNEISWLAQHRDDLLARNAPAGAMRTDNDDDDDDDDDDYDDDDDDDDNDNNNNDDGRSCRLATPVFIPGTAVELNGLSSSTLV